MLDKPAARVGQEASIVFEHLTLGYNSHPAVHHLDGVLARGSLTAVAGPNGSGKSTLMKAIAGILQPMTGRLSMGAGQRTAYLPQQSEVDRHFPARVFDLVALGLWHRRGLTGWMRKADKADVLAALSAVGLEGFEYRDLDTLSGGQLQRALFARVILQDADLILLDEPFNAVDTKTIGELIAVIKGWHDEGRTVMTVAHDQSLIREHFPQTLLLARQEIAWGPTQEVMTADNLARARRFTEAWNENAPWCDAPGDMGRHRDHANHGHSHDHAGHGHH
ncbi:MAG: zinc ABC transporter ATP-binding protein AztA [Rhizobiaceae bacterium]